MDARDARCAHEDDGDKQESEGGMDELWVRFRQVLAECVGVIKEPVESERWQQTFGKESRVGALAKLVAMYKSLQEQEAALAMRGRTDPEGAERPLSDEEWQLLAEAVDRWREGGDGGGEMDPRDARCTHEDGGGGV